MPLLENSSKTDNLYSSFLNSLLGERWHRLGTKRRAGVAVPLFSVYSKESLGIGEIPDLKLLVDWCEASGMSIIQLLPLNDVGYRFTPYDAESAFALDPMYLSLQKLCGLKNHAVEKFKENLTQLQSEFPTGTQRVNYGIKKAKIDLLWEAFENESFEEPPEFQDFVNTHHYWIWDYASFRVAKEQHREQSWEAWPEPLKNHDPIALGDFQQTHTRRIRFYQWIQWQLFVQFQDVRRYAQEKQVFFMGDIPFLTSRDSADVWTHKHYFKLDLSAGAPPDLYIAKGQNWGMPPYAWEAIAEDRYLYFEKKLQVTESFYDLFRIDHWVGFFRVWTIATSEPPENGGLHGVFDPSEEATWKAIGRERILALVQNTTMLPCAEDLGVIPDCSFEILEEMAIPGMDIQRWMRHWEGDGRFKEDSEYRKNGIVVISTHDMSPLKGWWQYEIGTTEETLFNQKCEEHHLDTEAIRKQLFNFQKSKHGRLRWKARLSEKKLLEVLGLPAEKAKPFLEAYQTTSKESALFLDYLGLSKTQADQTGFHKIAERSLFRSHEAPSIFSIQFLQDVLSLDKDFPLDGWQDRLNFPGSVGEHNWSWVCPYELEKIISLTINQTLKHLHESTNRV